MILGQTDYRAALKEIFQQRREKNPAYSMRAFAKAMGVTEPALSQVFAGKKNFSSETAVQIGANLRLDSKEAEYFVLLVQLKTAKSASAREAVKNKLRSLQVDISPRVMLDGDTFAEIADWYHLALLHMTRLENADFAPQSVARELGITVSQAKAALEKLAALRLIEPDPASPTRYRIGKGYFLAKSENADEGLRRFHRQMMEKAIASLSTQTPQEKIVGSETFAFSEEDLDEARRITESYFESMSALTRRPSKKTRVYHLGVQFFDMIKRDAP